LPLNGGGSNHKTNHPYEIYKMKKMNEFKMTHRTLTLVALLISATVSAQGFDARQLQGNGQTGSAIGAGGIPSATTGTMMSPAGVPQLRTATSLQMQGLSEASLKNNASEALLPLLPPLKPNEFQKFILESTGQKLALFGLDFFENTYAPALNAPVSSDYALGAGDEVLIRGWGSVDIDVKAVVDRNGAISIPKVGTVQLAGVKAARAEATIRAAIGRYYRDFELSVTMGQLRSITIYVVGQARKPGAYNVSSLSTLVSGLFASGGPNATGSLRHVQLKRANQTVVDFDLYAFLAKGLKQGDEKLVDGDVIVIPAAAGYVALTGAVTTPGVYELKDDKETIEDLLAVAGGTLVSAQLTQVKLERIAATANNAESRTVESFTLDAQGLKKTLRRGDSLFVPTLIAGFANAVTLRGNVSQPARQPWAAGMRVRDLIPSHSVLVSAASIQKQNQVLMQEMPKQDSKDKKDSTDNKDNKDTVETLASRIGNLLEEVNLDYAVIERVNPKDLSLQLIPFNLGNVLKDAADPDNQLLQPRDVVTVFSATDVRVPLAKRRVFVRVEGEVARPGVYQMVANDTLQTLVDKAGGLTRDAYLFGSAFHREEVRKSQEENLKNLVQRLEAESAGNLNQIAQSSGGASDVAIVQARVQMTQTLRKQSLERLRSLKPAGRIAMNLSPQVSNVVSQLPSIRLESGDRLVVPNRPDFVYVFGSVNTESALLHIAGKTVSDYLAQAGLGSGADRDNVILMRADGSAMTNSSSWGNSVMRTAVMPGDSIILPEKLDRESGWSAFTRNAKDITQILYQFGLGVAAYRTLR
jgi:protein involved in polysaccharide export with SLBB domain